MATLIEYEWKAPDEEIEHTFHVDPCPFCGEDDRLEFGERKILTYAYRVKCNNCGSMGAEFYEYQEAVDAWNERPA